MDLDAAAVDEQPVRRIIDPCERTEDAFPDAAFGPADGSGCRVSSSAHRHLRNPPSGHHSAAQRMDDPAQDPAVINAVNAG